MQIRYGVEYLLIWFGMTELYTDESPGLRVDPVVVLVLSLGFIFSVVALHGMFWFVNLSEVLNSNMATVIAKVTRKFAA